MADAYAEFVARKLATQPPTGIAGARFESPNLFPHQNALTQWALRRGRAAVFASMGLGKSRVSLSWAYRVLLETSTPPLILTPLAVAHQMQREASTIGVEAVVVRESSDVRRNAVNICNYDRLHKLDPSVFGAVACDESGCIKGLGSKTLEQLLAAFGSLRFRLALTATPAPNDFMELCQHAELLGIAKRAEVLAEYFTRDGGKTQDWEVKGHARKAWWRFVASWGALVRSPADLGFDASAYELPPLHKHVHIIEHDDSDAMANGRLFTERASTLMERRHARRKSMGERVRRCAELANDGDRWIVWCDFNDESKALSRSIDGAVELTGSMDIDAKEEALRRFIDGEARVLVSKPSLCGHGLNLQFCNKMAFAGISDSYEQQFQAVGRIHRFGQKREVHVHYFLSEPERNVLENIKRKEHDAAVMGEELSRETMEAMRAEVLGAGRLRDDYTPRASLAVPSWMRTSA